jgi:hypothetical protein
LRVILQLRKAEKKIPTSGEKKLAPNVDTKNSKKIQVAHLGTGRI